MIIFEYIVIASWTVFIAYWFISSFFVKKAVVKRNWKRMILWRVAVVAAFIIFIKFSKVGTVAKLGFLLQSAFSFPIAGAVLSVLGLAVAIWARVYLGRNWSGYVTYKKDHELVMTGPYRFIRHPIYAGMILMFLGTFLYYGLWCILVIYTIVTAMFIWRIKKEEAIMIKLFGEKYQEYMKRTKAVVPWVL